MEFRKRFTAFRENLEKKEWDKAGAFLGDMLEASSYEMLDAVRLDKIGSLRSWIDALVFTDLYQSHPKGQYLFWMLIRRLWSTAGDQERWNLLCCIGCLFRSHSSEVVSSEALMELMAGLADNFGADRSDILVVLFNHTK